MTRSRRNFSIAAASAATIWGTLSPASRARRNREKTCPMMSRGVALPFEVSYRGAGADRDVGPNRPDLIGDARPGSGDGRRTPYFNTVAIGSPGSAFARPAVGTFGNLRPNAFTGPGYWRVDATLFKRIRLRGRAAVELRVQAINAFNHVNLGNPDAEIGVPGNDNPGARFITSTAYFGTDPQRNFQFGARLTF